MKVKLTSHCTAFNPVKYSRETEIIIGSFSQLSATVRWFFSPLSLILNIRTLEHEVYLRWKQYQEPRKPKHYQKSNVINCKEKAVVVVSNSGKLNSQKIGYKLSSIYCTDLKKWKIGSQLKNACLQKAMQMSWFGMNNKMTPVHYDIYKQLHEICN